MSLNTIILPYNKISEVEECEPVSSPSSTSFEEHKSVPDLNLLYSPFYQSYNLPLQLSTKKSRSSPASIDSNYYQEFYFKTNNNENTSMFSQKNISNINNLNIDQEIKNNFDKDNSKVEKHPFQQYNYYSARSNQNPFQRAKDIDKNDGNESESSENPFSYANLRKNHRESEIIDKNKLNRIYDNYINNPKISPVKEDKQIDSFIEEISSPESKLKNMNSEDKNISINKKDLSRTKPKNNDKNKIDIPLNYNCRNSNPNPVIKSGIYCKKKITDSKRILGKNGKNDYNLSIDSIKRENIKEQNKSEREIKAKKGPLILNVNLKKNNLRLLKISQFQKIKNDGLFYILRFLDYYDIINLFKTKNKQICTLINTALVNTYYFNIKEPLMRYNNFLEVLKCTIVQSKIKDTLKFDFVLNFRFKNNNKNSNNNKYRINLNGSNNKFIEPLYLQFGYIYNYFQKVKNKKQLITKEEYEKEIKRLRMYDYYTFDLYPEKNKNNNKILKTPIFISKELSLFEKDGNNNIVNIQPILPFNINDKGIINLEIYTTNNGFIDPDSIKIVIKSYNLKNYIKMLNEKSINNPRISECEDLCIHWKNINLYQYHKSLVLRLKKIFEPFFEIKNIFFGNIGVFIFKVNLKAIKSGEINDKNKLEIKINIKEEGDYIENEIRKNNLLFERRDIFELRIGDEFLYYFSLK